MRHILLGSMTLTPAKTVQYFTCMCLVHLRVGPWFVSDPMWVLGYSVVIELPPHTDKTASRHWPFAFGSPWMGCMCVRKRFPFLRKLAPAEGGMYRRCGLLTWFWNQQMWTDFSSTTYL